MRSRPLALACCGVFFSVSVALGAAGDPDIGFGTGGVVTTHVGDVSEAYDMIRQSDGKLVIGGYVEEGTPPTTQFLLVRYESDGTLDAGFGTGGIVRTDAIPGQSTRMKALQQQADGKLLAVGFGQLANYWDGAGDVVLARYLSDGSLDPDFGTGGIVVTDVLGYPDQGSKVAIQPDGRLVVGGFSQTGASVATQDAVIARYEADGTPDTTFGTAGAVALDFGGIDRARAVTLQTDGSIVIVGTALLDTISPYSGPSQGILARVDADGAPDPTFGSGGTVLFTLGLRNGLTEMVQLPDGDLFATGSTSDGTSAHAILVRFDADGTLDQVVDPSPGLYFALGLAPSGAVLGAGPGFLWGHWNSMGVSRLDADGVLDATFGNGGRASVYPAGSFNSGGFAVVSEPDGSTITTAGFATDGPPVGQSGELRYIALARFLTTGPACSGDGDCDACERCDGGVCTNGPRTTCERPLVKGALLKYAGGPVKPRIQWKWPATSGAPGFDPRTDAVGLCIWWGDLPIYESSVPPGTGWRIAPSGTATFKDKTRSHFGIEKIKVGRSGIEVKASGDGIEANPNGFPDALFQPADDDVMLFVQLNAASGKCYSARYRQTQLPGTYSGHKRRGLGY
ncbi:MAG: delta-60 repeat domain-containing protein [Candidatus Binatia bacterium]